MRLDEAIRQKRMDGDIPEGVGVLVVRDGEILTGRRVGENTIGGPGGHMKTGETPEEAAVRETKEEFGITPKSLTALVKLSDDRNGGVVSHVFLCTDYDGEVMCDEIEMTSPEFCSLEDLIHKCRWNPETVFKPFARSLFRLMECLILQDCPDKTCAVRFPEVPVAVEETAPKPPVIVLPEEGGKLSPEQAEQIGQVVELIRSRHTLRTDR